MITAKEAREIAETVKINRNNEEFKKIITLLETNILNRAKDGFRTITVCGNYEPEIKEKLLEAGYILKDINQHELEILW